MKRINKHQYYLNIAKSVSERSTCLMKHWGAVIVKDDVIISTGFNGAPRKVKDCLEKGYCRLSEYRRKNKLGRGTAYEQCISTHAEMNAIIFGDKDSMNGATLYLYGTEMFDMDGEHRVVPFPNPCSECKKLIINAGIKEVVTIGDDNSIDTVLVNTWDETDITGGY